MSKPTPPPQPRRGQKQPPVTPPTPTVPLVVPPVTTPTVPVQPAPTTAKPPTPAPTVPTVVPPVTTPTVPVQPAPAENGGFIKTWWWVVIVLLLIGALGYHLYTNNKTKNAKPAASGTGTNTPSLLGNTNNTSSSSNSTNNVGGATNTPACGTNAPVAPATNAAGSAASSVVAGALSSAKSSGLNLSTNGGHLQIDKIKQGDNSYVMNANGGGNNIIQFVTPPNSGSGSSTTPKVAPSWLQGKPDNNGGEDLKPKAGKKIKLTIPPGKYHKYNIPPHWEVYPKTFDDITNLKAGINGEDVNVRKATFQQGLRSLEYRNDGSKTITIEVTFRPERN